MKRTDAEIKTDIICELEAEPVTRIVTIANLKVTVFDGKVTLEGQVDSYGSKMEAEELTFLIPGVAMVENKLRVALPEAHISPDAEIVREVRTRLALDQSIPGNSITIDAYEGVVTLGGQVEWYYQSQAATRDAAKVRGVKDIKNYITVNQSSISEVEIQARIAKAFLYRYKTLATNVMVAVQGSEVILLGTVETRKESALALAIAQRTPGVTRVTSNLIITSEQD